MKLVQLSDQNATHVVKQTTGHQYVCQMEQTKTKPKVTEQRTQKKQNLTINHNIGENSTWKLMQNTTTKKLRNKWKAWRSIVLIWPKEMKLSYSLTLNCQIKMASTSCVWRSTQGHKGIPYQFLHSVECSQKNWHRWFPKHKNTIYQQKTDSL